MFFTTDCKKTSAEKWLKGITFLIVSLSCFES
jgi:hypothetical protein